MNWLASRWSGALSGSLGLACYLALYAPWFILAQYSVGVTVMPGYWRLAGVLALAWLGARGGHEALRRLDGALRWHLALAGGAAGLLLVAYVVVLPLAGGPVHSFWWFFLGLVAWLRGLHLGIYPADNHDMQRQLVWGALTLAGALLTAHYWGYGEEVLRQSAPFILFWLVGVLVATGLLQLQELGERSPGARPAQHGFWPPLLVALASGFLALAVLFSWLAPGLVALLRWPALILWYGVRTLLSLVAYGLSWVVAGLLWLLQRLLTPAEPQVFQPPETFELGELGLEEVEAVSPLFMDTLKWLGLAALMVAAVALGVHLLLKSWKRRTTPPPEELRESYASLGALAGWAGARWQAWREQWQERGRPWRRRPSPASGVEVYHALLRLAAQRGEPRPPWSTPHQFQPRLDQCFPGSEAVTEEFSQAFIQEFYGEELATPGKKQRLREAWRAFQREWRVPPRTPPGSGAQRPGG